MKKFPWKKWFASDWRSDGEIAQASLLARGLWNEALNSMMHSDTHTLAGTPDVLSRDLRCSVAEFHAALGDLQKTKVADIEVRNDIVRLTSRRLLRESEQRRCARERQSKHRNKQNVTVTRSKTSVLHPTSISSDKGLFDCHEHVTSEYAYAYAYASASESDQIEKEIRSLSEASCAYCGCTERQTGRLHQREHFTPKCLGGGSEGNILTACFPCNQAKQGRLFATIEDCKAWLHWRFWSSGRKRYATHRRIAFGGLPPSPETVEKGVSLHATTVAQPDNSKLLGTSRFQKPTFPEMELYAAKIGLPATEINKFFDHYDANGWVQGHQGKPIISWQAAMRTWKTNWQSGIYANNRTGTGTNRSVGRENPANRGITRGPTDYGKAAATLNERNERRKEAQVAQQVARSDADTPTTGTLGI